MAAVAAGVSAVKGCAFVRREKAAGSVLSRKARPKRRRLRRKMQEDEDMVQKGGKGMKRKGRGVDAEDSAPLTIVREVVLRMCV